MSEIVNISTRDRDTLREQLANALPKGVSDGAPDGWSSVFVPSSHMRALSPRSMVVEGMRGSGKSFWTGVLSNPELRQELLRANADSQLGEEMGAITQTHVIALDKSSASGVFPNATEITDILSIAGITPELIWQVALLRLFPVDPALGMPGVVDKFEPWTADMRWASQNANRISRGIEFLDESLAIAKKMPLVIVDALDRVSSDFHEVTRMSEGLLRVMVQLRFAKAIRFKAFLREDILSRAGTSIIDGSKILNNKATLEWSQADLYGLLFHTIAQHESATRFRTIFDRVAKSAWKRPISTYINPGISDTTVQQNVWRALVGNYMGSSATKGHSYPYMFNHLADGKERVAPRTFLSAVSSALEHTQSRYQDKPYVIHYESIRDGVRDASQWRKRELNEDYKWIRPAFESVKDAGKTVPIDLLELQSVWKSSRGKMIAEIESLRGTALIPWRENTPLTDQIHALYETLEQIGAIKIRTRQGIERVDVPDIYRLAYRIGRPGGVPTQQKKQMK